jgi:hypothetical protein
MAEKAKIIRMFSSAIQVDAPVLLDVFYEQRTISWVLSIT